MTNCKCHKDPICSYDTILKIGNSIKETESLKSKLDKAREALEFYAEPDEWDTNKISTIDVEDVNIDGVSTNAPWGYPIVKGGKYARETLQKIKEEIL